MIVSIIVYFFVCLIKVAVLLTYKIKTEADSDFNAFNSLIRPTYPLPWGLQTVSVKFCYCERQMV